MATVKGTAFWASIQKPNTTYEPKWSVDLFVSEEDNQRLRDMGLTPKLVKTNKSGSISHNGREIGDEFFTFKRNVTRKDGTPNVPPRVVDAHRNAIPATVLVGNGSEVNVAFNTFEWSAAGNSGVATDLRGVQVIELAEFSAGEPEFEDVPGYTAPVVDEDDPFDD
jgi:hypothetical protein